MAERVRDVSGPSSLEWFGNKYTDHSPSEVLAGEVDIPNPAVCRAGGSTTNDMICTAPGQVYCITLEKTGQ